MRSNDYFEDCLPSNQGVQIRAVRPEENAFLERLSAQAFRPFGAYAGTIRGWADSGETLALLALVQGRPAGFAMASRVRPLDASPIETELLAIAVTPKEQRMGIGRLLLRRIQEETLKNDADLLFLHTATENLAARALFEAEGFRTVRLRPAFYPRGQDALLMIKDLRGK